MTTFAIEQRALYTYNNDPQRRCYNGCNASEATEMGAVECTRTRNARRPS